MKKIMLVVDRRVGQAAGEVEILPASGGLKPGGVGRERTAAARVRNVESRNAPGRGIAARRIEACQRVARMPCSAQKWLRAKG